MATDEEEIPTEPRADGVYDYSGGSRKVVELLVRDNNRYGKAPAGARVVVSLKTFTDPSVRRSCMTYAEAEQLKKEHERKRKAAVKQVGGIKKVIDEMLANMPERTPKTGKSLKDELADAVAARMGADKK